MVSYSNFCVPAKPNKARVGAIEERLRLLAHVSRSGDGQRDLEQSRNAAAVLRSWLRAPEPQTLSDKIQTRWLWILLTFAMVVAGAGLAISVDPWFALLAAAGAGIALPVFVLEQSKSLFQ